MALKDWFQNVYAILNAIILEECVWLMHAKEVDNFQIEDTKYM